MSIAPQVFVLKDEWDEDITPRLARRTWHALQRGLERTSGSTVKRLRGPWNGRAFRVRWGDRRAIGSRVPSPTGGDRVYIHLVAHRSTVYATAVARLDRFHDQLPKDPLAQASWHPTNAAAYQRVQIPDLGTEPDGRDEEAHVELLLSKAQFDLLDQLVAVAPHRSANGAPMVVGKGPPGCGKTVVAIDAAREAQHRGHYGVLVLVPSRRLYAAYATAFDQADMVWSRWEWPRVVLPATVSLCETPDFLGQLAGETLPSAERERRVSEWWGQALEQPALRAWANRHPEVRTARFCMLVDAMLELPGGLEANAKDALDSSDAPLYELMHELRDHRAWLALLSSTRQRRGLRLRFEVAQAAGKVLKPQAATWGDNLLIVVDECQDLVPAEWKLLVDWTLARNQAGKLTRLALLGDENQRVSPTSFSWAELAQYAAEQCSIERPVTSLELPGSYRLGQQVAAVARELFHESVTKLGKVRHTRPIDPSALPVSGRVHVVVARDPIAEVAGAIERFEVFTAGDTRLVVLSTTEASALGQLTQGAPGRVDIFHPRVAKGLEFETALVVQPLGGTGEQLTFERAAEAYTMLTRALGTLICVLTPAEWALVRPRWSTCGAVEVLDLCGESPDRAALDALVRAGAGEVDVEERVQRLAAQLRDALEQLPTSSMGKYEARRHLKTLVTLAEQLLRYGGVAAVGHEFGGTLTGHESLHRTARTLADELEDGSDLRQLVVLLLLLGEYAAVVDVIERCPRGAERDVLLPGAAKFLEHQSDAHEIALGIRRHGLYRASVPGDTLVEMGLLCETIARLKGVPLEQESIA